MRNYFLTICFLFASILVYGQAGHIMHGVGAVNMSMGGAATAQPLDISGAMQWNPATLTSFDGSIIKLDVGLFKGTPTLYSSLPADGMGPGSPAVSGLTESELGISPMPALAFAWGKAESKHKFGISMFGVSGFGVDFPEETNNPFSPTFNPGENSNPILYPQQANGFGHLESSYMLLQVGFTWAYQVDEHFSIGVQPTINYSSLELSPSPLASPFDAQGNFLGGYPKTDNAVAYGFGGQLGLFYDSHKGFKAGISYKTPQYFSAFEFNNTYPDGSTGTNEFTMNFPAIYSIGLGYSKGDFDLALDYRYVEYSGTDGFEKSGWEIGGNGYPTGAVNGFGWENMSILSAGIQYKGIKRVPIRLGYTHSTNPIQDEQAMFSIPATAIIANAFQVGVSYEASEKFQFDLLGHYGVSDGKTSGQILNPMFISESNPLGKFPGSEVAYDMETWMFQVGVSYKFGKK